MKSTTYRLLNVIALFCVGAVAIALVSQHVFDMPPCAWCVLQRLIFLAIAATCWLGMLAARFGGLAPRIAACVSALLACGGLVAGWYQHTVASEMVSCDLTFADRFMVEAGLDAGIPWLFGIYASCMDARVELLGVEYVLWAMALFTILIILSVVAALQRSR
jgi:disulfide bond formation protein DsbB